MEPVTPNYLRAAVANALSDVVMSLIALGVVGSACIRWAQGINTTDAHGISVGVIVAYFFARNHLTALNEMRRTETADAVTREIKEATHENS